MRPARIAIVLLLSLGLQPSVGQTQSDDSQFAIDAIKYFFTHPPYEAHLRSVVIAVRRPANQEGIRRELRAEFQKYWIERQWNADVDAASVLDALAQASPPFGLIIPGLVDLLAGPRAPGAWNLADFREYVRAELPARIGGATTSERLLDRRPTAPAEIIERMAFLMDVLSGEGAALSQIRESLLRAPLNSAIAEPDRPSTRTPWTGSLDQLRAFQRPKKSAYPPRAGRSPIHPLASHLARDRNGAYHAGDEFK